jgi:23S rRNA pseudoU1915 N3-methylase RlmH
MQKITLEINNSIYEYIMFFLENIPKNLLRIKKEPQEKVEGTNVDEMDESETKELLKRVNDMRCHTVKPLSREEIFNGIC